MEKSFLRFLGQTGQKKWVEKEVFQVILKVIIGKNFLFKFLGQMGLKMGPKIGPNEFFYVLREVNAWNFSGFRMKLKQHKGLKLT